MKNAEKHAKKHGMVSIIVPIYNAERHIRHCVESILLQTYTDIELILVDDGSDDQSSIICDEYAEKEQNVVVVHKPHGGLISSRKIGIIKAKGEYISFVDSDDWIERDFIEMFFSETVYTNEVDVYIGGYKYDRNGVEELIFDMGEARVYEDKDDALIDLFKGKLFNWSLCGKLYKKWLFADLVHLWEIHGDCGEDTEAIWKLFQKARKIAYLPIAGYHYCINLNSMTHQLSWKEWLAYLDRLIIIIHEAKRKKKSLRAAIAKVFFQYSTKYLVEMMQSGIDYRWLVQKYQLYLRNSVIEMRYQPTQCEKRRFYIATMDYDQAKKWFHKRKGVMLKKCKNFIEKYEKVFIYGAGRIADEALSFLKDNRFSCEGFIVTSPQMKAYRGYSVISINDFQRQFLNSCGIIVALNRSNTHEVVKILNTHEIMDYLNFGKYSLLY